MHHHVEEQRQGPVQHVAHPTVVGLALLHPNLSGQMGPALSRLLSRSKLGRSILRPLLRTEVGEVSNRRSWYNLDKLTPEVRWRKRRGGRASGFVGGLPWGVGGLAPAASALVGLGARACLS